MRELYSNIELPLARVLARMERNGVRIDRTELQRLSTMMEGEIARLTGRIHALAGKPFNISSPQQLGRVLFEDLKLPAPVKYGKGKTISTAADVLETLAADHEIVRKVLEYRQLTKLKGTYVDALPALIDPRTGRLHTSFNQTGAATGRLSSSNPNLQNIPIRTELGREIRAAFVPRAGWKLLAADYSQIELRLLAHMSGDPLLVEAFRDGEDIHTRTASEVLGVPPLMVTPEARRNAKAVNFGIVYGISPFGLAAQLGISRARGGKVHRELFRALQPACAASSTRPSRRCARPALRARCSGASGPSPISTAATPTRAALPSAPRSTRRLQGTAADLIKLAMVRIDAALESRRLSHRHAAAGARRAGVRMPAGGSGRGLAAGEARDGRRARADGAADRGYRGGRQLARLGCVPLAGMTAFFALRRVTGSVAVRVWAAASACCRSRSGRPAGRVGSAVAFALIPVIGMLAGRMLSQPPKLARRAGRATGLAAFVPLL